MQMRNFSKILSKILEKYFFDNNTSFSGRDRRALSYDMRIIVLLLIMREAQAFLCKDVLFAKFALKFWKNTFLKISRHFLVENARPFRLIRKLLFYC